ncbi:hypothetical protein [Kibdelosporangium aridum]|uniref:hypothetical protein n=1 Tax=Kibdelosporangium aridum TaxID=2030 RepID=UPI000567EC8D|nr:hypothetical protein [Kibdelosporangium aridum]
MLIFRFKQDAWRRQACDAGDSNFDFWSHLDDLERAQATFLAQHLVALACCELAREQLLLECLTAFSRDSVELKLSF